MTLPICHQCTAIITHVSERTTNDLRKAFEAVAGPSPGEWFGEKDLCDDCAKKAA